ncbi:uncharacterized protein LOC122666011 [Telopea speciosissima]|uniref:uncharacterized protein LOC122666011 n=1 Tax=Telopea speciosissima TaxID=54955 RepID=UPI001CC716C9|nr:uncharacterized protein LOC122666011 [Telopea speciosissima]
MSWGIPNGMLMLKASWKRRWNVRAPYMHRCPEEGFGNMKLRATLCNCLFIKFLLIHVRSVNTPSLFILMQFGSKRIMAAYAFDDHRVEPSRLHPIPEPKLDSHRAASAQQHVRALNAQFASWVQYQMQNHPNELWEDGVQDYLAHASQIMETFRDVVDWLKANAAKAENASLGSPISEKKLVPEAKSIEIKQLQEKSIFGLAGPTFKQANAAKAESVSIWSHISEKKSLPEPKSNETKTLQEKSVFGLAGGTANFTSSWNSTVLFNNQSGILNMLFPTLSGYQNSVPLNLATDDPDGENDMEQPSSPSVKKTEEKGIVVVHEVKCKLYAKSTDPVDKDAWKDKGMGQLSIKCQEGASKATKESKPIIIVRNDVGKVLLNALLYPGIKTNLQKNSIIAIFHTLDENGGSNGGNDAVMARTYSIRTKTEEERNKLAAAIQEYAPAS